MRPNATAGTAPKDHGASRVDTTLDLGGQRLALLPEKAAWWRGDADANADSKAGRPAAPGGVLFVADLHFGKGDVFRRRGIPVPHAAVEADLHRLSSLLERTGARRLVVLGDLLHGRVDPGDAVVETVARWREQHDDVAAHVVRGNHDRAAGPPPASWGMACHDEPCVLDGVPFVLRHHPADDERGVVLCGHLHPAVTPRTQGPREATRRLACFVVERGRVVLPAFGSFTGTHRVGRAEGRRVFAVAETRVIELPDAMIR